MVPDNAKHCPLSLMDFKEDLDPSSELQVRPAVGEWEEGQVILLNLKTAQLSIFNSTQIPDPLRCKGVKVVWFFGSGSPPKGTRRSVQATNSKTGDLQWRIVHGKIATNRHRAPRSRDMGGVFCGECETLKHLCVGCSRLTGLVSVVIK